MSPTSLLEDYKQTNNGVDEEASVNEEDRGFPNRKTVSTNVERGLENQRERSMALNSEGLEVDPLLTFSFNNILSKITDFVFCLHCSLEVNGLDPNMVFDRTLWRHSIHVADPT